MKGKDKQDWYEEIIEEEEDKPKPDDSNDTSK